MPHRRVYRRPPLQGDMFAVELIEGLTQQERAAAAQLAAEYHAIGHPRVEFVAGLVDRRTGRLLERK